MSRRAQELLVTPLVLVIFIMVALISMRFFVRIDLTESKAYSISQVSRDLFAEIPEQVTITYYVSQRLRERFPQPQEIIDLLDEYGASSRGAIVVDVVDLASRVSPDVEALGVVPQQLQVNEDGEQILAVVYSAIVISYLDRYSTLPFSFSTATLEYEITSAVRELVTEESKNVGILVSRTNESVEANYTFAASQLSRSYDVRVLSPEEPIPDDIDVLIVIAAQDLGSTALFELDHYLVRGGSVLISVDYIDIDEGLVPVSKAGAPVFAMLAHHGFTIGEALLLDESHNQIMIQEVRAGFTVQNILPYEHWVATLQQYTSSEHPVTSRFTGLDLYWPTTVEVTETEGTSRQIIVASTPQAWLMGEPYYTNPQEGAVFRMNAAETRKQYGIVAVGAGPFESYFANRGDSVGTDANRSGSGRIMVVSDSDFLRDRLIQATRSGANLAFVEAAAQWLSNDEDLLEIRTRGERDLRLNNIDDPVRKRAIVIVAQLVSIYLVPAVVILFGVVRFGRRRRRALESGGVG